MIATWRMAYQGIEKAFPKLAKGAFAGDVLEESINHVEDFTNFISVGYGGLPNEEGKVQLDAAYMNGSTLEIGAVAGMEEVHRPISVAKALSKERFNSMRVGKGAKKFAESKGFKIDSLLTEQAKKKWEERKNKVEADELDAYDGHDTIGTVVLDQNKNIVTGVSSSGLFMKKDGRVGDSPLSGSGYYADSEIGGACATGVGEDLMKGVLSYEVVRKMEEGCSPMEAAKQSLFFFEQKLKRKYGKAGAMSLVCMNKHGEWGIATNVEFTFVVATEKENLTIYIANKNGDEEMTVRQATKEWIADYLSQVDNQLE